jgi:RNA 2',3'-cyclic 3'-phosphodiesterase
LGSGELEEDPRSLNVRAFFGLSVPEPQREQLGRFIAECAHLAPDFRWTPTENLHVTIRFIGNVGRAVVEGIADALAGRPLPAFELELGAIGTFGRGRMVRVVWLELRAGSDAAAGLAALVDEECLRAGLAGQERPFQGHLTLARARARDGSRLPELQAPPRLDPWRADDLVLYSSRLTRGGAIYEAIRNLPLAG